MCLSDAPQAMYTVQIRVTHGHERRCPVNKQHWLLVAALCLVQAEVSAADIFKCKSADGKVTYRGQPAVEKGTKCEQMMQKKTGGQSITTIGQDVPPGMNSNDMDTGGMPPEMDTGGKSAGAKPQQAAPVESPPASAAAAKPAANQKAPAAAADAEKKKADQEKAKQEQAKKQQEEADRKLREKNCAAAQANLRQLQQGGRIATTNDKGEREYLSDADRGAKISEAQQDVDQWCAAK